jgi:acyl dehydratase
MPTAASPSGGPAGQATASLGHIRAGRRRRWRSGLRLRNCGGLAARRRRPGDSRFMSQPQIPPATRALSEDDFTAPIGDRYLEDYAPGAVYEYGHVSVTESEILDYATAFDPQPIHVDPAYAAAGPFGGLIASGWHTAGIFTRLFVTHYVSRVASLASPGVDELRWPVPLRPGDSVRLRATILDARPSRSKPDRGLVRTRGQLISQNDEDVLRLDLMNIIARRHPHS